MIDNTNSTTKHAVGSKMSYIRRQYHREGHVLPHTASIADCTPFTPERPLDVYSVLVELDGLSSCRSLLQKHEHASNSQGEW